MDSINVKSLEILLDILRFYSRRLFGLWSVRKKVWSCTYVHTAINVPSA